MKKKPSTIELMQIDVMNILIEQYKPYKHLQIRLPNAMYDKLREQSYLQKRSMQAIVLELFEREFGK